MLEDFWIIYFPLVIREVVKQRFVRNRPSKNSKPALLLPQSYRWEILDNYPPGAPAEFCFLRKQWLCDYAVCLFSWLLFVNRPHFFPKKYCETPSQFQLPLKERWKIQISKFLKLSRIEVLFGNFSSKLVEKKKNLSTCLFQDNVYQENYAGKFSYVLSLQKWKIPNALIGSVLNSVENNHTVKYFFQVE